MIVWKRHHDFNLSAKDKTSFEDDARILLQKRVYWQEKTI
jgi:hypothetical protein